MAPADDRHRALDDEQLVVHAAVQAPEVARHVHPTANAAAACPGEGVEQTHLRTVVCRHAEQQPVHARGVEVIDQQAHAHAALRGVAQLAQHLAAYGVVGQLIDLEVDRGPGQADQAQAGIERHPAVGEAQHAGRAMAPFTFERPRRNGAQRRVRTGCDGQGRRQRLGQRRQTGASADQQDQQQWCQEMPKQ